jgi:hypothetical protein
MRPSTQTSRPRHSGRAPVRPALPLLARRPRRLRVLLVAVAAAGLASVLPLAAARAAAAEGRGEGIVNVLLAVDADEEGRDVNHLLANPAKESGLAY